MNRSLRFAVTLTTGATLAAFALTGCSQSASDQTNNGANATATAPNLETYYQQQPAWQSCNKDKRQTCADFTVPLDYTDVSKGDIKIAVSRTTSSDPKKTAKQNKKSANQTGVIFTNPGGPGGSGVQFLPYMVTMLGPKVLAKYDVVGFDPRGVGKSVPVECLDTAQMDKFMADLGTPNNLTSAAQVANSAASMGAGCQQDSSRTMAYLGTNNTARDMDIIRRVLGKAKASYFGASYGTYLGQVYATLFPDSVARFVFDGVVPMWANLEETGFGQAKGFEKTFERFVENCPQHSGCPLPKNKTKAMAKVQQLLVDLGSKVLPINGSAQGRQLTQALGYNGILAALYDSTFGWSELRTALKQAFNGNGAGLLQLSDSYADRENNQYGGVLESYYAISCLDQDGGLDVTETAALGKQWAKAAPLFGDYMAWTALPCGTWPAPVDLPPNHDNWSKLPGMLLINYSEDPATPYEWADQVAKEMPKASLVKVNGASHVAAFDGIECVDNSIQDFYLKGTLPASRATCSNK